MGIRYFGISVDLRDYEHMAAGPCPTCGARPQLFESDDEWIERDTLDLDKSWHYLQHFLAQDAPRPGQLLVAGNVVNTNTGWISHHGTVGPSDVPAVAADLASVTPEALKQYFEIDGQWAFDRSAEDYRYVYEHLAHAVEFTCKVANEGRAIVYYMG